MSSNKVDLLHIIKVVFLYFIKAVFSILKLIFP